MKLNLSDKPEFEMRKPCRYLYVRTHAPFPDHAPQAWSELHRLLGVTDLMREGREFAGICWDEEQHVAEKDARYDAALLLDKDSENIDVPSGMKLGTLPGGRYARFIYQGPYSNLALAFDQALTRWAAPSGAKLRRAPYLEVYLNNPETTPPQDLKTAILIPVE